MKEDGGETLTRHGERGVSIYRGLVAKHEGKGTTGSPRSGWEVTTKQRLKEIGRNVLDFIYREQHRNNWSAVVNQVMKIWSIKCREFLVLLRYYQFITEDSSPLSYLLLHNVSNSERQIDPDVPAQPLCVC